MSHHSKTFILLLQFFWREIYGYQRYHFHLNKKLYVDIGHRKDIPQKSLKFALAECEHVTLTMTEQQSQQLAVVIQNIAL